MEAPDSAPTLAVVNQSGTSRNTNLDSTTMTLVSTGRYRAVYTASSSDDLEQLVWSFSVVEGGSTRAYANNSSVVDEVLTDFTASDRTTLEALADRLTSDRAGYLDALNVSGALAHSDAADLYKADVSALATSAAVSAIDTVVDAIQAVTDNLPDSGALDDLATLVSRLTALRAGYLDKLNIGTETIAHTGNASSFQADVSALATTANLEARTILAGQYSTFDASSDTVDIGAVAGEAVTGVEDFQATDVDLTGIALTSDVTSARDAILTEGASSWTTADVDLSGIPAAVDSELTSSHGEGSWITADVPDPGANVVTLTVEDEGGDPISGAVVRVTEVGGAATFSATSDASGVVEFSLDSGDWRLSVTKPLYSYTPSTLTVSGAESETLTMSQVAITPLEDLTYCIVRVKSVDEEGVAQEGIPITMEFRAPPADSEGYAFSDEDQVELTDSDGYAYLTGVRGAKYAISRGTDCNRMQKLVTLPTDKNVVEPTSFVG